MKRHRKVNMASASGDYVQGKDLDELFSLIDGGFLDYDKSFDEEIAAIPCLLSPEHSIDTVIACDSCGKVCKSQRGLARHKRTHEMKTTPTTSAPIQLTKEEKSMKVLHPLKLKAFIVKCSEEVASDLCYPEKLRKNFQNFTFSNDNAYQLWCKINHVTDSFNGDAEAFYSKFYGLFKENLLPASFEDKDL